MNKEQFLLRYSRNYLGDRWHSLTAVAQSSFERDNLYTIVDKYMDQISTKTGVFAGYPAEFCAYHAKNKQKHAEELQTHMLAVLKSGMENNENLINHNLGNSTFKTLQEAFYNVTAQLEPSYEPYEERFLSMAKDGANTAGAIDAALNVILLDLAQEVAYYQAALDRETEPLSDDELDTIAKPEFLKSEQKDEKMQKIAKLIGNIKTLDQYGLKLKHLARQKKIELKNGSQPGDK